MKNNEYGFPQAVPTTAQRAVGTVISFIAGGLFGYYVVPILLFLLMLLFVLLFGGLMKSLPELPIIGVLIVALLASIVVVGVYKAGKSSQPRQQKNRGTPATCREDSMKLNPPLFFVVCAVLRPDP